MRVVVISGTLGAGKTFAATAVHELLVSRGERCAVIDLDWLSQNDPAPRDDPFNDRLTFANLAAIWPNYVSSGTTHLVLARVVEDEGDRRRYESALPGGEVRIVRLEASSRERGRRLQARMLEGPSLQWHLARTDALADRLRQLALEDLVLSNEATTGPELASDILAGLSWAHRSVE